MRHLRDDLAQAGYRGIGPGGLLGACGVGFVLTLVTITALTAVPAIALCFAVMAGWVPLAVVRMRARARRAHLRDLWPDAVDNVTSAVRAGLALPGSEQSATHRARPAEHGRRGRSTVRPRPVARR